MTKFTPILEEMLKHEDMSEVMDVISIWADRIDEEQQYGYTYAISDIIDILRLRNDKSISLSELEGLYTHHPEDLKERIRKKKQKKS